MRRVGIAAVLVLLSAAPLALVAAPAAYAEEAAKPSAEHRYVIGVSGMT
ncbi:MAG: hypothetical protein HY699_00990 [Deltaproteobacteria bacterium]|nr:hypothetical protein [Deltaproteobacteria bacterium]